MSSTKTPSPCVSRLSSLRGTFWPDHVFCGATTSAGAVSIVVVLRLAPPLHRRSSRRLRSCGAPSNLRPCRLDRLEDVPVAGAAADVALQAFPDLLVGRARMLA